MLATQELSEHRWSTLQEPIHSSSYPASYLRLLSALDHGWKIIQAELHPSWDQTGFVYSIVLEQPFTWKTEELILPRNDIVAEILERNNALVAE